ncbi:MAG: DHH family phosphoesterase [Sphaerochaetaceae bacterium]
MNEALKERILSRIEQHDSIIITRHIRPDGDAVGSTKGLKRILELTYPEKTIRLISDDQSSYMEFLGPDDPQASDEVYAESLLIVLDTATFDRISNSKRSLAKETIKIDHHVDVEPFGDIEWVEEERSSVCEMIADFWQTFSDRLKIDTFAASCIYTGMVTDSGRFMFPGTSGQTMRLAGAMLDQGIDIQTLYAHLYLEDFQYYKFKADILEHMKLSPNGVAYTYIDRNMQRRFKLTAEQASSSVSFMEKIRGSLIWIAFIENEDATIRVRLRSRFLPINKLAEKYSGGGHANASGATVHSEQELAALVADADSLLKDYKADNEGWL